MFYVPGVVIHKDIHNLFCVLYVGKYLHLTFVNTFILLYNRKGQIHFWLLLHF